MLQNHINSYKRKNHIHKQKKYNFCIFPAIKTKQVSNETIASIKNSHDSANILSGWILTHVSKDVLLILLCTPTSRHVQNEGSEQIYDMNHYCMTIIMQCWRRNISLISTAFATSHPCLRSSFSFLHYQSFWASFRSRSIPLELSPYDNFQHLTNF